MSLLAGWAMRSAAIVATTRIYWRVNNERSPDDFHHTSSIDRAAWIIWMRFCIPQLAKHLTTKAELTSFLGKVSCGERLHNRRRRRVPFTMSTAWDGSEFQCPTLLWPKKPLDARHCTHFPCAKSARWIFYDRPKGIIDTYRHFHKTRMQCIWNSIAFDSLRRIQLWSGLEPLTRAAPQN